MTKEKPRDEVVIQGHRLVSGGNPDDTLWDLISHPISQKILEVVLTYNHSENSAHWLIMQQVSEKAGIYPAATQLYLLKAIGLIKTPRRRDRGKGNRVYYQVNLDLWEEIIRRYSDKTT